MTYRLNNGHSFKDGRGGGAHKGGWHGLTDSTNTDWFVSAYARKYIKREKRRADRRQCRQIIRQELYAMVCAQADDFEEFEFVDDYDDPYNNFSWTVFEDEIPPGMNREYWDYASGPDWIDEALTDLFRW